MKSKWSVGAKIGSAFALALGILVVIGVVAYQSTTSFIDSAASVTHTHEVLQKVQLLVAKLVDAETGQRGYLLTGQDRYLDPYTAALGEIDGLARDVRRLTADNPSQQKRLDAMDPLITSKLATMKETIDLRRTKSLEAAVPTVLLDRGKQLMDDIRKVESDLEAEENRLLSVRAEQERTLAQSTESTITVGTTTAFLVFVLIGTLLTRSIAPPLTEMSFAAEKIAVGDLAVTIAANPRADEIGNLARSFSRMTVSLQDMAGLAKQIAARDLRVQVRPQSDRDVLGNSFAIMVDNLRRSTTDLAEGVNVLASSSSEILAATSQVAAGAAESGTAIAQTTTTIEEVKQTALVSSQKAKTVSDSAQRVAQTALTGKKSVEDLIDGMKRIKMQMESIAESVIRLSEQGQAIGEIIATVNDIAEQSNLLSVNAAIEAAKAGEYGRGFGVVAQEVKSLAEQSKHATAQVRTILGDIQKATTAAVLATEQGNKAVDAGVQQSTEAGEAIRLLASGISDAAQAAAQIAASSQQQLVGTDQVAIAMESIKQASMQNVAGTKQAESAAHNLHELGQRLKRLVDQYQV